MSTVSAIGGQVIFDHGPACLCTASALARFYRAEAALPVHSQDWRALCRGRADALALAIDRASGWRRAAGWRMPEEADGV
ncbi:MAG TPA: hypothetical protein VGN38_05095 [Caulobacteraceae bacterium]|jgi:hypothetical protein|nr:hypothetical protein [Caulobacteraceae bacterium]